MSSRRKRTPLVQLATLLDVPDCDCPLQTVCLAGLGYRGYDPEKCPGPETCFRCALHAPVCEHVLRADDMLIEWTGTDDFDACFDELSRVVRASAPDDYADRPLGVPDIAISQEDRECLYSLRAAAGRSIFHPDDVVYLDEVSVDADDGNGPLRKQSIVGPRRDYA